jgi:hypothetical protein
MERRLRIDPFAFVFGALALLTFGFVQARNGGAVIMCALCVAGLVTARVLGFSNRALVPLTAGLVILLWIAWVHPPDMTAHQTSALIHGIGGVLVGWAVSEYLRLRLPWPLWAIGAVGIVFGLTLMWELGEWLGDRELDTALNSSRRDSAIDVAFGTLGGSVGTMIAAIVPAPRRRG